MILQSVKSDAVVSSQPRPVNGSTNGAKRPININLPHLGHVVPKMPQNTPSNPQNPGIIVSELANEIHTSQTVTDSRNGASNPEIVGELISSIVVEDDSETKAEQKPTGESEISSSQIVVTSETSTDLSSYEHVGENLETTVISTENTSSTVKKTPENSETIKSENEKIASQSTVVSSSKSEVHTITSSTTKVTLSQSTSGGQLINGVITSEIANDLLNKNAISSGHEQSSIVIVSEPAESIAQIGSTIEVTPAEPIYAVPQKLKKDEYKMLATEIVDDHSQKPESTEQIVATIEITPSEPIYAVPHKKKDEHQMLTNETVTKTPVPNSPNKAEPNGHIASSLVVNQTEPEKIESVELRNSHETNREVSSENRSSTFEAFKNFVDGLLSSNGATHQTESVEPKFDANSQIVNGDKLESSKDLTVEVKAESNEKSDENQVVSTLVHENVSVDIGLSSPALVKEITASKVDMLPSEYLLFNDPTASSVTTTSTTFVELPNNGYHKEVTSSTCEVISSHPKSEADIDNDEKRVTFSETISSGPVIVEHSTADFNLKTDLSSSALTTSTIKSSFEESHTASSSLESTYYEAECTSCESKTEHFSSTQEYSTSTSSVEVHSYDSRSSVDHSSSHDSPDNDSFDCD